MSKEDNVDSEVTVEAKTDVNLHVEDGVNVLAEAAVHLEAEGAALDEVPVSGESQKCEGFLMDRRTNEEILETVKKPILPTARVLVFDTPSLDTGNDDFLQGALGESSLHIPLIEGLDVDKLWDGISKDDPTRIAGDCAQDVKSIHVPAEENEKGGGVDETEKEEPKEDLKMMIQEEESQGGSDQKSQYPPEIQTEIEESTKAFVLDEKSITSYDSTRPLMMDEGKLPAKSEKIGKAVLEEPLFDLHIDDDDSGELKPKPEKEDVSEDDKAQNTSGHLQIKPPKRRFLPSRLVDAQLLEQDPEKKWRPFTDPKLWELVKSGIAKRAKVDFIVASLWKYFTSKKTPDEKE